jgi:hypothetical protein
MILMGVLMKKIRHFQCLNKHLTEALTKDDKLEIICGECGSVAERLISAGRYFSNTTGKSPSAKSY